MIRSGLLRRAADRLWRVDFHDPLLAPLIILLEFQSTPDPRMAWRILEYRTLALEEAVKQGVAGPSGLRPLFLAIVIYNGTEAWNDPAAGERPVPENLLDYESPRLYRLLDMHRWAELLDMELDEEEEESMLAETVKRWTEEWYQEGRQEGRQEGSARGAGRSAGRSARGSARVGRKVGKRAPLPHCAIW